MRLFVKNVAPTLIGGSESTRPSAARQAHGWELQHQGAHDPYDNGDDASEREIPGEAM